MKLNLTIPNIGKEVQNIILTHSFLDIKILQPLWEIMMAVHTPALWSRMSTLRYFPKRNENTYPQKSPKNNTYNNIHRNFIDITFG